MVIEATLKRAILYKRRPNGVSDPRTVTEDPRSRRKPFTSNAEVAVDTGTSMLAGPSSVIGELTRWAGELVSALGFCFGLVVKMLVICTFFISLYIGIKFSFLFVVNFSSIFFCVQQRLELWEGPFSDGFVDAFSDTLSFFLNLLVLNYN